MADTTPNATNDAEQNKAAAVPPAAANMSDDGDAPAGASRGTKRAMPDDEAAVRRLIQSHDLSAIDEVPDGVLQGAAVRELLRSVLEDTNKYKRELTEVNRVKIKHAEATVNGVFDYMEPIAEQIGVPLEQLRLMRERSLSQARCDDPVVRDHITDFSTTIVRASKMAQEEAKREREAREAAERELAEVRQQIEARKNIDVVKNTAARRIYTRTGNDAAAAPSGVATASASATAAANVPAFAAKWIAKTVSVPVAASKAASDVAPPPATPAAAATLPPTPAEPAAAALKSAFSKALSSSAMAQAAMYDTFDARLGAHVPKASETPLAYQLAMTRPDSFNALAGHSAQGPAWRGGLNPRVIEAMERRRLDDIETSAPERI